MAKLLVNFECSDCGYEFTNVDTDKLDEIRYCSYCGERFEKIHKSFNVNEDFIDCIECKYYDKTENEEPCCECLHSHVDKFEMR